ncbi:hypothetical protein BpHYR1_012632 [Brachionus plicatilis]|uniref:Uncharacterized protein n=1 Tax=Brachionus plicatilis TaxID=10195 RepID=A0A3M7SV87_BRAPC|nr:hypothetical protein BpHYR1_012632 [Brachionus plicatilis]
MNFNKEKNNPKLILLRICKDYLMFLLSLELQRSFNSSTIGLNVSFESNVIPKNLTFSSLFKLLSSERQTSSWNKDKNFISQNAVDTIIRVV